MASNYRSMFLQNLTITANSIGLYDATGNALTNS